MADYAAIRDWILASATKNDDGLELLDGLLSRLVDAGVPLWRLSLGMSTIDPVLRGLSFISWRGGRSLVDASANDAQGDAAFQKSPIFFAQSRGVLDCRWNLENAAEPDGLPLLESLRRQGGTDYILRLVPFRDQPGPGSGVAFAFATDRPGGFEDSHVAVFDGLLPALGLVGRCLSVARTANEALSIYLGSRTGQRVLAGDIQRGKGQKISAAVLIADLRGFTTLTDQEDALSVVGWLDEHLDLIGTEVERHGGEVLKFLGDGLLAIFPFTPDPASSMQACDQALAAADQALQRTKLLNAERQTRAEPRLDLDVVLHAGDVVYGNVGASRRLDFTIIGSVVNEASRMEQYCETLNRNLLISEPFALLCSRPTVSLGPVKLRGISGERTIWALVEP